MELKIRQSITNKIVALLVSSQKFNFFMVIEITGVIVINVAGLFPSGNGSNEETTKKIFSLQEDEVKVWSDYLRMRYHPKTNLILQEYQNGNTTR